MSGKQPASSRPYTPTDPRADEIFPPQPWRCTDITARSRSLIKLSPENHVGNFPVAAFVHVPEGCAPRARDAVSHPGCARSSPSAMCVSSARLLPDVTGGRGLQKFSSRAASAGMLRMHSPASSRAMFALAETVIEAIGIAVLDPQPLRRTQLVALRRLRILHRFLISDVSTCLSHLLGFRLEAFHHLKRVAVAGLPGLALIAAHGRPSRGQGRPPGRHRSKHYARSCGNNPSRLAISLSKVRLGSTAAIRRCIGSGTSV